MKKLFSIFAIFLSAGVLCSCAPESVDDPFGGNNELPPGAGQSSSSSGLWAQSSSSRPAVVTGSYYDSRDGQSYGTVTIGGRTWMAKNLNYNGYGGVCYDNQNSYCNEYGRLYNWEAAMSACPNGWRLPRMNDWERLGDDARHLKANYGWEEGGNGWDTYGFAALPGGIGYSDGNFFSDAGYNGIWWISSEYGEYASIIAYNGLMFYNIEHDENRFYITDGLCSVRCVQD
jgi:uncharacterized protein (TIGR02145 family)